MFCSQSVPYESCMHMWKSQTCILNGEILVSSDICCRFSILLEESYVFSTSAGSSF